MTARSSHGPRPTDAELVLLIDGELDREREAEVRSWVDADGELRRIVSALRLTGRLVEREALARADRAGAGSIVDSVMARVERATALESSARDRGRRSVAGTALVVAAAAAAVIWLPRLATTDRLPPVAAVADSASDAVVAEPPVPSTEIDAVDFGARAGSIFYVRSGVATTAVVWLSDDDGVEARPDVP